MLDVQKKTEKTKITTDLKRSRYEKETGTFR